VSQLNILDINKVKFQIHLPYKLFVDIELVTNYIVKIIFQKYQLTSFVSGKEKCLALCLLLNQEFATFI